MVEDIQERVNFSGVCKIIKILHDFSDEKLIHTIQDMVSSTDIDIIYVNSGEANLVVRGIRKVSPSIKNQIDSDRDKAILQVKNYCDDKNNKFKVEAVSQEIDALLTSKEEHLPRLFNRGTTEKLIRFYNKEQYAEFFAEILVLVIEEDLNQANKYDKRVQTLYKPNNSLLYSKIKEKFLLETNISCRLKSNLTYITNEYKTKYSEQKMDLITSFYTRINSDFGILSTVIYNEADVRDEELVSFCLNNLASDSNAPLFLYGAGGSGKTTLLLTLAIDLSDNEDIAVYIISLDDNIDMNNIREDLELISAQNKQSYIFLDSPFANHDIVKLIYKNSIDKFQNIKFIFSERTNRLELLFSSLQLTLWEDESIGIHLSNSDNPQRSHGFGIFLEGHTLNYLLNTNWKKKIINKMLSFLSDKLQLDLQGLTKENIENYSQYSIVELFYSIIYKYNKSLSKENSVTMKTWYPFDWSEWERLMKDVNRKLSLSFAYIATLSYFNIPTRVQLLANFSEITVSLLLDDFKKIRLDSTNEPVNWDINKGEITLKHDMVADMFFQYKSDNRNIQSYIEELIDGNFMDEETIIEFEKNVFSLKRIVRSPDNIDFRRLIKKFSSNDFYMKLLQKKEREYSLDLAWIYTLDKEIGREKKNNEWRKLIRKYPQNIDVMAAFLIENNYFPIEKAYKYAYMLFQHYESYEKILDILRDGDIVLSDLSVDIDGLVTKENYQLINSTALSLTKRKHNKIAKYLFEKIAGLISNDAQSVNGLAKIHENDKEYSEAQKLYNKAYELDKNNVSNINSLINFYQKYGKDLGKSRWDVQEKIENLFNESLKIDERNLITRRQRLNFLLKERRDFDRAEKEGIAILENYPKDGITLNLLAMLYCRPDRENSTFDFKKAELYFEKAKKHILYRDKLANVTHYVTYGNMKFLKGELNEAKALYENALKIHPNDKNAHKGIDIIKYESNILDYLSSCDEIKFVDNIPICRSNVWKYCIFIFWELKKDSPRFWKIQKIIRTFNQQGVHSLYLYRIRQQISLPKYYQKSTNVVQLCFKKFPIEKMGIPSIVEQK